MKPIQLTVMALLLTLVAPGCSTRSQLVTKPTTVKVPVTKLIGVPEQLTRVAPMPKRAEPLTYGALKLWTADLLLWGIGSAEQLQRIEQLAPPQ